MPARNNQGTFLRRNGLGFLIRLHFGIMAINHVLVAAEVARAAVAVDAAKGSSRGRGR